MLQLKLLTVLTLTLGLCIATTFDDLNVVNGNIQETSNDADTVTSQSPLDSFINFVLGLFGVYDPKGYGKALKTDLAAVLSSLNTADTNQGNPENTLTAAVECQDSSDGAAPSASWIADYAMTFNDITPMANKVGNAADRVPVYPYCAEIKASLSSINDAINDSYNDIKIKCYGSVNSTPCCAEESTTDPPDCSTKSCSATPDLDTAWKASMAAVTGAIGKYDIICEIPSV